MSESLTSQILRKDRTHKNSVRLVLLALAECIDSGNSCPPIADIADMAQVTVPSARNALAELEADKTITIEKQAGKSEKGGRTNCYAIHLPSDAKPDAAPVVNDPVENSQGNENHTVEFSQGTKIPQCETFTPDPAENSQGHSTVEYVRGDAREDKELLKEFKEPAEKQTNSLKPEDTRAQDVAPMTEADLQREFESKDADVQAFASKAIAAAMSHQDALNPGSAKPLPPAVRSAYLRHFDRDEVDEHERQALDKLLDKYGHDRLVAFIWAAPKRDSKQDTIRNPACYMLTIEPRQKAYIARNHQQEDKPKEKSYGTGSGLRLLDDVQEVSGVTG